MPPTPSSVYPPFLDVPSMGYLLAVIWAEEAASRDQLRAIWRWNTRYDGSNPHTILPMADLHTGVFPGTSPEEFVRFTAGFIAGVTEVYAARTERDPARDARIAECRAIDENDVRNESRPFRLDIPAHLTWYFLSCAKPLAARGGA